MRAKLEKRAPSMEDMEDKSAAGGIDFIDESNLFEAITDLAGLRIIHLHTEPVEPDAAALFRRRPRKVHGASESGTARAT